MVSRIKTLVADPLRFVIFEEGSTWNKFCCEAQPPDDPADLEDFKAGQHDELLIMFLNLFLNNVCSMTG